MIADTKSGEMSSFQNYSIDDDDEVARIDVMPVQANQQSSASYNLNANYTDPPPTYEETVTAGAPKNNNYWSIEHYQKYFDVQTDEVIDRIKSSVVPQNMASNFFDERINIKPDLYGPIWISVTLIFTIAVSGNIASYLQSANKTVHWRYDFHLVSYAATAIVGYVWMIPLALWAALKWSIVVDSQDQVETQRSNSPTAISLLCLYGYSLSIYIPVAILWTIQVSWLQWLLVLLAATISGAVLIYWLLPTLRKSKYFFVLTAAIPLVHFVLAMGFMLYFFHVPT